VKLILFIIFLVAAVSWIFVGYLVWFIPAKIEGRVALTNLAYLLVSGTLGISLTISFLHYFVGSFFLPKTRNLDQTTPSKKLLLVSLRRGFLISLPIAGIILLNAFEIFNLLNAALIIGIALLAEIYFSSR